MSSAYRKLVSEWRSTQLRATQANVKRLERVFDSAVKSMAEKVADAPDPESASLLNELDAVLHTLRTDFAALLEVAALEVAQVAASREAATAKLVGASNDPSLFPDLDRNVLLGDGSEVSVKFGLVAQSAVERAANRVYSDGWKLSDRLYSLDAATRTVVQDQIVQGVAEQISAREMAKRLQAALAEGGKATPRYQAMRIARTEINTAHREAHIAAAVDATGSLKPYILAIGWRLSLSHPHRDICDVWASDDGAGLGAGNYKPEDVPTDHPHGLCYTVSVLVDYPDASAPSAQPAPADVPEAQARYYAKQGDPTAERWLAQYGAKSAEEDGS